MAYYGQKNAANGVAGLDTGGLIFVAQMPLAIPAVNISGGGVSNTVFNYLIGVTSPIQTQINNITSGLTNFSAAAGFTPTSTGIASSLTPATSADTDGQTLTSGELVFVNSTFNSGGSTTAAPAGGVYVFNGYTVAMTRALAMSTWAEVVGSRVYIDAGGTAEGGTVWVNTNQLGGTLGTTAVTYTESYNNYVGTSNQIVVTGNIISLAANITGVTSLALGAATNQLVLLNTTVNAPAGSATVFTIASATSNSVQPLTTVAGSVVGFIDNTGTQNRVVVINQVLTSFSATAGTVANTDTIVQAINKLAFSADTNYDVNHQTVSYQFLKTDIAVILDNNTLTGTLPNATTVIPGVEYKLTLGSGASTGTLAVPSGESLSGVLNGTFTISGASNGAAAYSDGSAWFLC